LYWLEKNAIKIFQHYLYSFEQAIITQNCSTILELRSSVIFYIRFFPAASLLYKCVTSILIYCL